MYALMDTETYTILLIVLLLQLLALLQNSYVVIFSDIIQI